MSSASGLFSTRRSRSDRNAGHSAQLESDRERFPLNLHNHRLPSHRPSRNRLRHRDVLCDTARPGGGPSSHANHICRFASPQEHELFPSGNPGTTESSTSNNGQMEALNTGGSTYYRTDSLPGTVLQARARLLERLRGVSLTRRRQRNTVSGTSWNDFLVSDDFRVFDSGAMDSEVSVEWFRFGPSFADSTVQEELLSSFQNPSKKPPGLAQNALDNLQREVFSDEVNNDAVRAVSPECSICLEKFLNGDGIIRLPCSHRFHPSCLIPWVKTCGDCPYCRTVIVADPKQQQATTSA